MKNLREELAKNPMNNASKFIGRLFEARDVAHKEHFKVTGTGSYAAHKALNEFYDGILDLADGFVESYQGKYGILSFEIKPGNVLDFIEYILELAKYIEVSREIFNKDCYLQNQVDEMVSLCYSTIYKLKFLK